MLHLGRLLTHDRTLELRNLFPTLGALFLRPRLLDLRARLLVPGTPLHTLWLRGTQGGRSLPRLDLPTCGLGHGRGLRTVDPAGWVDGPRSRSLPALRGSQLRSLTGADPFLGPFRPGGGCHRNPLGVPTGRSLAGDRRADIGSPVHPLPVRFRWGGIRPSRTRFGGAEDRIGHARGLGRRDGAAFHAHRLVAFAPAERCAVPLGGTWGRAGLLSATVVANGVFGPRQTGRGFDG